MDYRFLAALLITVCAALAGRAFSMSRKRRAVAIGKLLAGLQVLRFSMLDGLEPLDAALRRSGNIFLQKVADQLSPLADASTAWMQVKAELCGREMEGDCLKQQELDALDDLFRRMDCPAEQLNAVFDTCMNELSAIREEAAASASEAGRLYAYVGSLTGLAIAVILI